MPSEPVDTVEVCNPDNPSEKMIINRVDFDPDKHELWEESGEASEAEEASESAEMEKEG